jgi:predicted phosphoribosyltransferase
LAALHPMRAQGAAKVIVAVPVASPDRPAQIRCHSDDVVFLLAPAEFLAIGQFYEDITQVEDAEVVALLREFATATPASPGQAAT